MAIPARQPRQRALPLSAGRGDPAYIVSPCRYIGEDGANHFLHPEALCG